MWSLPDINALNAKAAKGKSALEQALHTRVEPETGEPVECELCEDRADSVWLWYDIFSDDPKGIVGTCSEHDGFQEEQFFTCGDCEKLFIRYYIHELYFHPSEDGDICLNCWADRVLADDSKFWIELDGFQPAKLSWEALEGSPHCIAVSGEDQVVEKHGLNFIGNVEVDNSSGGRITGGSSSEHGFEGTVREVAGLIVEARSRGYTRAVVLVDAAYQFATSLGVYGNGKHPECHNCGHCYDREPQNGYYTCAECHVHTRADVVSKKEVKSKCQHRTHK